MKKLSLILVGGLLCTMLVGCDTASVEALNKNAVEEALPALMEGEESLDSMMKDIQEKVNEVTAE